MNLGTGLYAYDMQATGPAHGIRKSCMNEAARIEQATA